MSSPLKTPFSPVTCLLAIGAWLVVATGVANAEDSPFVCRGAALPAGAGAKILAEVQAAYGSLRSLEAEFVQDSYLAALDVSERSSGSMSYERPGQMRWEYTTPEPQTFLVRESTVWFYQPRERQVLVDEFRDVLISDIPVAFLMGLGKLTDDFVVARGCVAGSTTVLELTPKESEHGGGLKSFTLLVDDRRLPSGAQVTDVGGNITGIRLTGRKPNGTIDAERFRAEIPAGTDVNDQRVRKGA